MQSININVDLARIVRDLHLASTLPSHVDLHSLSIGVQSLVDAHPTDDSIEAMHNSIMRQPLVIMSPSTGEFGNGPAFAFASVAKGIMTSMGKAPLTRAKEGAHAVGSCRVVISSQEPVTTVAQGKNSMMSLFDVHASSQHNNRRTVIDVDSGGSSSSSSSSSSHNHNGGVYAMTTQEMTYFVLQLMYHPTLNNAPIHHIEHKAERHRQYAFLLPYVHMMYTNNRVAGGCNWLPVAAIQHTLNIEKRRTGSHKYYPIVNHYLIHYLLGEGCIHPLARYNEFKRSSPEFHLFVVLSLQSCSAGHPVESTDACPNVRIRNAMCSPLPQCGPTNTSVYFTAMSATMLAATTTLITELKTQSSIAPYYYEFYEFCKRILNTDWLTSITMTAKGAAQAASLDTVQLEVMTPAAMLVKVRRDNDMGMYRSLITDPRARGSTGFIAVMCTTRDHCCPVVASTCRQVEVQRKRKVMDTAANGSSSSSSVTLPKTTNDRCSRYGEVCKIFVIAGVTSEELVILLDHMKPVVDLLVSVGGQPFDPAPSIHSCIDSTHHIASCCLIAPPMYMYVVATVTRLQSYRLELLGRDVTDDRRRLLLTHVMETYAQALKYVGEYGVWILARSFLRHFRDFRHDGSSVFDCMKAVEPTSLGVVQMRTVLMLARLFGLSAMFDDVKYAGPQMQSSMAVLIQSLVESVTLQTDPTEVSKMTTTRKELLTLFGAGDVSCYNIERAKSTINRILLVWSDVVAPFSRRRTTMVPLLTYVSRSGSYDTNPDTRGSFTPAADAAVMRTRVAARPLLQLLETSSGLSGAWSWNEEHEVLYTTTTVPSVGFNSQLSVILNHSSHPIIMRDAVALMSRVDSWVAGKRLDIDVINSKFKIEQSAADVQRHVEKERRTHEVEWKHAVREEDLKYQHTQNDDDEKRVVTARTAVRLNIITPSSSSSSSLPPAVIKATSPAYDPDDEPPPSPRYDPHDTGSPVYDPHTDHPPPATATSPSRRYPSSTIEYPPTPPPPTDPDAPMRSDCNRSSGVAQAYFENLDDDEEEDEDDE